MYKIFAGIIGTAIFLSDAFAQERNETLIYAEQSIPVIFNPLNIKDDSEFRLSQLIFNNLICEDRQRRIRGDLLKEDLEGNNYTFTLQRRARWHNDRPFTAEDIKFTFDMIKANNTDTNLGYIRRIVNRVVPQGDYSVRFELYNSMSLDSLLTNIGYIPIISRNQFPNCTRLTRNDFNNILIQGTGPYKLNSWDIGKIELEWHRSYHRGWGTLTPTQHRIRYIEIEQVKEPETAITKLIHKDIDLLPTVRLNDWERFSPSTQLELKKYNIRSFYFVALNCNSEYFRNRRVRKALALAIDRWRILTTIYGEKNVNRDDIMSGPYLPEDVSPTQQPLPYNLQEARQLLRDAGFPNGFAVELKANIRNEEELQMVDNIRRDLGEIGVRVTIREMDKDTWRREVEVEKNFQMAFGKYTFHQHTDIVEALFLSNSPLNFCSYDNETVERLIGEIKQSLNTEEKERRRDRIQQIIREDCPYIFLFRTPLACGYLSDLHIKVHPYWFFGYVNQWYKE